MQLNGGFPIIYTDNPWDYDNNQNNDPARGGIPYKQMKISDLCNMGELVQSVAAKDCALFMWATVPKIPEALACMNAWGFKFITVPFVWVKLNETGEVWRPDEKLTVINKTGDIVGQLNPKDIVLKGGLVSGLGYYTNTNIEFCMLGKRGSPKRVARNVKQLVFEPVPDGEESVDFMETVSVEAPRLKPHSKKPEEVADRIKILMGDIPGLELFGRPPKRKGWLKLGYEIDGKDIRDALQELK
jgi:N6-adenosine-specific RNA methylase IME4